MCRKCMKINFWIISLFLFFLGGCCADKSCERAHQAANAHEEKLKKYFTAAPGDRSEDVSSLAKETQAIADQLRAHGDFKTANRFDSYRDVLLYGNHTIDESLDDVLKLVKNKELESSKAKDACAPKTFTEKVKNFFSCDCDKNK